MIERIEGMQRRQEVKGGIVDALAQIVISEIALEGSENLQIVRRLASINMPIIFMPNHLSNLDAPAITNALSRNGFSDIAEKLVFLLGIKLKKNPFTNPFRRSFSTITVWPPSLEPKNEKDKKERIATHRNSLLAAKKTLKYHHLVIFPEATRSRTGSLIKGQPAIMHYIPDNALIVPVGIRGTEKALKPGTLIPRRSPVTVAFGQPFNMQNIIDNIDSTLSPKERREQSMDYIMRSIARTLPEQYRGVYA